MRILLSPDAGDGTGPAANQPGTSQVPPPVNGNAAPSPESLARPPAAETVNNGRSEREAELAAELEEERRRHVTTAAEKKSREQRICELEDENRQLKSIPKPTPAPSRGIMEDFLGL